MYTLVKNCSKFVNAALLLLFLPIVGLYLASFAVKQVFATSETVNLQGKIVRDDAGNEGLNVTTGSPSCVVLGPANDTCDFRVKYYSADTAGTLLGTETFNNVEIGEYNGIFDLKLGAGTYAAGSETSFRNIFLNNTTVFVEMDFAPDGTTFSETFLTDAGKRMGVRAAAYAISAGGANKQFQFDIANDETGYTNIAKGQVYYDGDNDVLKVFNGTDWLAIQANLGNVSSLWDLNTAADPDVVYSHAGLDVAIGGTDSSSPFFFDISEELLSLTNTTTGLSFRVNDSAGDTTPFAIDADGNVGIGTATPQASLDVVGRTAKYSNLNPEYKWLWSNGADLNWKTVADITLGTGTYMGASFVVDVIDSRSNFGHDSAVKDMTYYVSAIRSMSVQDDTDSGSVSGPSDEYVRLVKTNTGYYQLQVRSPLEWNMVTFRIQMISSCLACGSISVDYVDNPATGSSSGTIYTASPNNFSYFSNTYVSGNLGVGNTDTDGAKFKVSGNSDQVQEVISGFSTQTANLTEWQSSGGSVLAGVTSNGTIFSNTSIRSPEFLIGLTSSTGYLGIQANTTAKAQINLLSSEGVDVTSPVSGDMWWNGTNLYFYDGSSTVDLLVGTGGSGSGSLFTDGGAVTYLTSITDDLALGGTDSSAPFFFDEGAELLTLTNSTLGLSFRVNDEANDTTPFVIDANGNVGIGTDTPSARLDIAGAASIITNTSGDITFDSASGLFSFAGDSITNLLNANISGNVILNGGQLQLTNYAVDPTAVGDGSMAYNNVSQQLMYSQGGNWRQVVGVTGATTGQTVRFNGTNWESSSVLVNNGTDLEVNGQLRVGNYTTKPTGTGEGSLVYDTTVGSLFVYDGTDWQAISTGQMKMTNGTVPNGSYLELSHGLNTLDVIASAWVKVGSQWKQANDIWNNITHNLGNQFEANFSAKKKAQSVGVSMGQNDLGTGSDGSIDVSSSVSINTTPLIAGRSCPDGGDAVNYNVTSLTSNTAVLESSPTYNAGSPLTSCLYPGDEVLLINLRGIYGAFGNVGNYETLRIAGINNQTITFTTNKTKYYGDGLSDDTNIGLSANNQTVMLQRVPNYTDVTVDTGINFYPDEWIQPDGTVNNGKGEGGIMFFRATGDVSISGTIHANAKGYIGFWDNDPGYAAASYSAGGDGGESICGIGGSGGYAGTAGSGAAGGGAGHATSNGYNGGNGSCGGGGGVTANSSATGLGSTSSGGAGGGGASYYGGGGGGGYGTPAQGGSPTAGVPYIGQDGGTNSSGNGGYNAINSAYAGGGGGGTYGDSQLNKLYFGSAGGEGGEYAHTTSYPNSYSGKGGDGGGIVFIAANSVTVSGNLQANAENGGNGGAGATYVDAGGGGGAGGSIRVAGNSLNLGTTKTSVTGGTGGLGNSAGTYASHINGGYGGSGRIAVYYGSSIVGTPAGAQTYNLSYNKFAVYVGEEVETPNATSFGNISWTENLPTNTEIQVQTRSGSTPDSTDGTWEAWKPSTITTNYISIHDANAHTDWTGSNLTVADGDVIRNVDYFEDEDESSAAKTTKFTSTAANGSAGATITATDISSYRYLTAWVRSSSSTSAITMGIGETAANENTFTHYVDQINTWQKVYWDLSSIVGSSRDGITKINFTIGSNATDVYIDNIRAENALSTAAGSAITSTADSYIQYRFILTTTDTSVAPTLSNVRVGYTNPSGTYTIDANRVRFENDSEYYSSNRLNIIEKSLRSDQKTNLRISEDSISINSSVDLGTGSDGNITVSSDVSINTVSLTDGRTCPDGGDAVNYNVTSLTSNTAVLESAPTYNAGSPLTSCLYPGDEILLINLRGTYTAFNNVGNNETLRILSINNQTITFTTSKTKYYGDGVSDDSNIGVGTGNQTVMLQRVPNYNNVTVNTGINFYPDDWVQPDGTVNNGKGEGGVMFFRATGDVNVSGTIHANAKGYIGFWDNDAGVDTNGSSAGGNGGESVCGIGGVGGFNGAGTNGASGGGAGHYISTGYTGGNGYCGGGGGVSVNSGDTGLGSATSGGAGGGGGEYYGGGGGGGYGTFGQAGSPGGSAPYRGQDGGTNSSGNGGYNAINSAYAGGGGGGTYGDAQLSKLYFGSSGGEGGEYTHNAQNHYPGKGGDGAGIVVIAANSVIISGNLQANAENGGNANGAASIYDAGGGGGAGGSIKILGNSINLGVSKVTASGGTGGLGYSSGSNATYMNGGYGGNGRIAVFYLNSYSGTGVTPGASVSATQTDTYGIYISNEVETPKATGMGQLSWYEDLNKHGLIQLQTRTGNSSNSTDGSWEEWKPMINNVNEKSVETADTHTDWVGTNATVSEGDITRNMDYYEDEDELTATSLTKITSSTSGGYAESTISSLSLADFDYISIWVRSTQTGSVIKLGIGESAATENENTIGIEATNTWQKVYWDISDIPYHLRDGITKLRLTNLTSTSNTIYIDNIEAGRYMRNAGGTTVSSTPGQYIQYRVILSTSNTGYSPTLYNIKLAWSNGFKIELTDANTARVYNYSGESQDLRLSVSGGGGTSGGGTEWTTVGGNIYRATGHVGIGDSTPDVELKVVGALCVKADANDCAGATAGTIYANNTSVQSADLAEMYKVSDLSIEKGDIVSLDPNVVGEVQKANSDNISNLMGVISTAPGLLMNDERSENSRPVGLIGRLPVKVMTTGVSVEKGDVITASILPGIGVVRKEPGMVVAKTLEDTYEWSDAACKQVSSMDEIKWPKDSGQNENHPCFKIPVDSFDAQTRSVLASEYNLLESDHVFIGKVLAFVDVVWYQPEWVSNDIAKVVNDYNLGILGGNGGGWRLDNDQLKADKEVNVNSILGNRADFSILSTGLLNIGGGKITADSGGNLGVSGDLLLKGSLKSESGNILVQLGDTDGFNLFEIKNGAGETVFSVDSKGEVAGKGVYKSQWLKINANSNIVVKHNYDKTPSEINIVRSNNSNGDGFTSQGLGTDFYYEYNDSNSVKVYNKTNQAMYVKLTIKR